jgi:glucitol operon activator protein
MQYIFLVVAAAWMLQFLLAYWQLQRFHRRISELRRLGRCAVGSAGNRWRGRTYAVLVLDPDKCVRHAESFSGWTVFSKLRPIAGLDGMLLDGILSASVPPTGVHPSQWAALQHAAQFFP